MLLQRTWTAAENGHPAGQNFYGWCLDQGYGTVQNLQQAVSWFEKAAQQGNDTAQYNMGLYFAKGLGGLRQSWGKAAFWYRKAAEQGNHDAQLELVACLEKGLGVPQNRQETAYWRKKHRTDSRSKENRMAFQSERHPVFLSGISIVFEKSSPGTPYTIHINTISTKNTERSIHYEMLLS